MGVVPIISRHVGGARREGDKSDLHSQKLTWKWRMAPWKTMFNYKQVVFHFHVSSRESKEGRVSRVVVQHTYGLKKSPKKSITWQVRGGDQRSCHHDVS